MQLLSCCLAILAVLKLEDVKAVAKEGWEEEADKIVGNIEKDKVMISAQLSRRVLIHTC